VVDSSGGQESPLSLESQVGGWYVVGTEGLLMFQAREVVVVGANLLRRSNREREGGGWQATPFERGRWSWWV
jgi:hypothetical protein